MKKIVFLLAVLLLVGGSISAQKKNVNKAKANLLSQTPDTKAAKEAILLALKDSTTDKLASTWFTAGEVFNAIYKEQQALTWQKKGDLVLMAQSLESSLQDFLIADSLDQLPDVKGKIKPKYHVKIVEYVKAYQRGFTDAGSAYYDKKDFKTSLKMFAVYLDYPNIACMKGLGLEKDTLRPLITYYCALSATQAEDIVTANKYFETIKDSMDSKFIYSRLSEHYTTLKDTVNMLRMFQLGAKKFPGEQYYVRNLINYYININGMADALNWIEEAIRQDPKSSVLWNVKGRIVENDKKIEEAKACFQKSIDFDDKFGDAYGNLGRIYYNKAVEENDRVQAIKDNAKYKIEKAKLKSAFQLPLPYFEKAILLNPDERDYIVALRGIYYNLGMDAKYQIMDKRLKEMSTSTK